MSSHPLSKPGKDLPTEAKTHSSKPEFPRRAKSENDKDQPAEEHPAKYELVQTANEEAVKEDFAKEIGKDTSTKQCLYYNNPAWPEHRIKELCAVVGPGIGEYMSHNADGGRVADGGESGQGDY